MKPTVLKILTFACLLAAATSCQKSSSNTTVPPKTKTVLLTQASWKIQSVGIDADRNGVAETDVTNNISACQLDNVYTFKSDGTGVMDEAALKCNTTDPQTKPFTWVFKTNETILSGTFAFSSNDATIISMTDTALTIAYDDTFGTNTSYHVVAVLKH